MGLLGPVALGLQALGTASSFYAQRQAGDIARDTAEYNAKVQENAAIQADLEAREQVYRQRQEARRIIGGQRAVFAGAGVVGTTGSPLEVMALNAGRLELEALETSRRARLARERGFAEAAMTRRKGALARVASRREAMGSLLSNTANLAGSAYTFHRMGAI